MPDRRPPLPIDPLALKDAARGLRHLAREAGQTLREALPLIALPGPAALALDAIQHLGEAAERRVSTLAHAALDNAGPVALADPALAEERFAAALYLGLAQALKRLGADAPLIRETAARAAWRQALAAGPGSDSLMAGRLYLALGSTRPLRDATLPRDEDLSLSRAERLAVFAVLLAMLADPSRAMDLVPASLDLTLALGADLEAAVTPDAVGRLFEEFRHHV